MSALGDPHMAGRHVTLRLGTTPSYDLDYRIPTLLCDALNQGVSLHLEGDPRTVREWWDRIRPTIVTVGDPPAQRRRHLRAIPS